MAGFAWFYLRPVRGPLAILFVVALAAGSVEASLYLLMGWFVDILAKSGPETLWRDHGTGLMLAAALILVARPVLSWLHEVLSNQFVVPQTTSLIRCAPISTRSPRPVVFPGRLRRRLANR